MVHLIITDAEMPGMDGYVVCQTIKEDERFRDIPVIMHSSLSSEANQSLAQKVKIDRYVPKFQPAELATAITEVLKERPPPTVDPMKPSS